MYNKGVEAHCLRWSAVCGWRLPH